MVRLAWLAGPLLVVCGVGVCSAQPVPAAEAAPARLFLNVNASGDARVFLFLSHEPAEVQALEHGLSAGLGQPLQDVRAATREKTGTWMLSANCPGVFPQRGFAHEGEVDLDPLVAALRLAKVRELTVSLTHPRQGFSSCTPATRAGQGKALIGYRFKTSVFETPPKLRLAFGYPVGVLARLAILAGVLLAPVGLTLWARWRSLRGGGTVSADVGLGFWRFQQALGRATWCFWLAAFAEPRVRKLVFEELGAAQPGRSFTAAAVLLLPPVLIVLCCRLLGAAVFTRVSEIGWTHGRVFWRAVLGQAAFVSPILAMAACLSAAVARDLFRSWGWLILSVYVPLLCLSLLLQLRGQFYTLISPGELRDRVTALAKKASLARFPFIPLGLLPASRWRLASLFAPVSASIALTPPLLENLSKREVDALLAQEVMYAHRHRNRLLALILSMGIAYCLVIVALGDPSATQNDFGAPSMAVVVLAWLFLSLLVRSRPRFGPALDREAVALTGDPEALITAFVKLERLSLMPANPHPLPLRTRLDRIAHRAGLPPERLPALLENPATGDERYTLPEGTDTEAITTDANDPSQAWSRASKKRQLGRLGWSLIVVTIGTPMLVAWAVDRSGLSGWAMGIAYFGGLALILGVRSQAHSGWAMRFINHTRRRLADRLKQEGLDPAGWETAFVGFAPADRPQLYDGFDVWDTGFLVFTRHQLSFLGWRNRFGLRRSQVGQVRLGPGWPSWRKQFRIYVTWHDSERGVSGTFYLEALKPRPPWNPARGERELNQRMRQWWLSPSAAGADTPEALYSLKAPDLHPPSGTLAGARQTALAIFCSVVPMGLLAAALYWLVGLPLDPDGGEGAWFIVLAPAAVTLWQHLPFWLARDPEPQLLE
jgi:Zn-dependent protease with chaperone function